MIASLTTSDLRNTLCGRLKLQETQKMKMTLSHTVWPIIDILQNTKFLLRKRYKIKRTVTIIWLFQLNFPSKRLPPYILNWVGNWSNKKITIKFNTWPLLYHKSPWEDFIEPFFATFEDISRPFLASTLSKSWFLLDLLFLRFLQYLSWAFLASKKNPCYFCDFCDICGHFGALLGFFAFLSLEFCYICYFCDFCDICHGCF